MVPDILATLHIADLWRDPRMRLPTLRDWRKIPRYLDGTWPTPIPPSHVFTGDMPRLERWFAHALAAPYVAIDTEYNPETRYLTLLGAGYPGMAEALQVEWAHLWTVRRARVVEHLEHLVSRVPVVFQNALADLPVLETNCGLAYTAYRRIDDTMLAHAALWSELPHTLEFLASLYDTHPKLKHLAHVDPLRYNLGDVIATIDVWEALRVELAADPESASVYELQSLPLIPVILARHQKGLRVNTARVEPAALDVEAARADAVNLAQSYAGYPLNVGSDDQLKTLLYTIEGLPLQRAKDTRQPTINEEAIGVLQAASPEHPVLEARAAYAAAQQTLSHFIAPARGVERVYPSFKIHAQASGRWSITDPPLQQLPVELEDLIVPDVDETWLGWDWSQIEPRVLEALAGDRDALARWDEDRYERWTGVIFPGSTPADADWTQKRKFTKVFILRLHYRGDPRGAGSIKGARALGLVGPTLVQASNRYIVSRPAIAAFWRCEEARIRASHESRTFCGRRRRLLGDGKATLREGINHMMQGAVADILNLTLVGIARDLPWSSLAWTKHDAAYIAVPTARVAEAWPVVRRHVEQEWTIGDVTVQFPASYKERAC